MRHLYATLVLLGGLLTLSVTLQACGGDDTSNRAGTPDGGSDATTDQQPSPDVAGGDAVDAIESGTCSPSSCAGCCNGTSCVTPTTNDMCGKGGGTCAPCAAGLGCSGAHSCASLAVVFGGLGAGVSSDGGVPVFADTWEWDGASWTVRASVMRPSGRYWSAMAALQGRMVLFGGIDDGGTFLADTWEWNGGAWTQRTVSGPPARRQSWAATLNGKIVLFGGHGNGGDLGDTWEWDGTAWTQRNVTGPLARVRHRMATLNGKVVLFGGFGSPDGGLNVMLGDTWEWDGTTWTQKTVVGPPARAGHVMGTVNGKVVIYGGEGDGFTTLYDTWEWDGTAWTKKSPANTPAPRFDSGMASVGGQLAIFGGTDAQSNALAETWQWDGTTWTQSNVTGPAARDPMMAGY